jgi:hypothetical protein
VIQEGDKLGDRTLEINVVFPECVIGVNHQRLARCFQVITNRHAQTV